MNKKSTYCCNYTYSILFFYFLLCTNNVRSQPESQTFYSSGSYTIPTGFTASLTIQAWGGGGGGGSNTAGAKGGGSGGAYASSTVTLGEGTYSVIVGAGGTAGNAGGNSNFSNIVIAEGGGSTNGTAGGVCGTSSGSTGTTIISASNGSAANGDDGGAGSSAPNCEGTGGSAGMANNGSGINGASPGGGGGGKAGPGNNGTSGNGGNGRVIVTVNTTLPVKFNSIKAIEKLNGVQLHWIVSAEENLIKYVVEKSFDGSQFIPIGEVESRNSIIETSYSFFDAIIFHIIGYYRIRSVRIDGQFAISPVIKVNLNKQVKDISLYPNPVKGDYVSFQASDLSKGNYVMKVFNNRGVQVLEKSLTHSGGSINQTLKLPVGISPGFYFLQLINDEVKVMNKSFIVNK
jgi:hypothetical protein